MNSLPQRSAAFRPQQFPVNTGRLLPRSAPVSGAVSQPGPERSAPVSGAASQPAPLTFAFFSRPARCARGRARSVRAFTLIELLVVIAVISILAAMIFPVTKAVNRAKIRRRATTELQQVQAAIESYKAKLGHYPPDTPGRAPRWTPWINQLYYELKGTSSTNNGTVYATLDGTAQITSSAIPQVFGANVTGLINSSQGGGDEARGAQNFIPDLRPSGFMMVNVPPHAGAAGGPAFLLGTTIEGAIMLPGVNGGKLNPWRYNSSSPTNNPSSYDLWIDVTIAGVTNRICNWTTTPFLVSQPW